MPKKQAEYRDPRTFELPDCPHCGASAQAFHLGSGGRAECSDRSRCGARIDCREGGIEEAIKRWVRRA